MGLKSAANRREPDEHRVFYLTAAGISASESSSGGFTRMSSKRFVEIGSVLVNPEIFTRPYTCDVVGYDCKSQAR